MKTRRRKRPRWRASEWLFRVPMLPVLLSQDEVFRFAAALFRVGGIMAFAPFFSSRAVPFQARIVLTLVASVALFPTVPAGFMSAGATLVSVSEFVLTEVAFGVVLGLVASFVFAALQLAGQIIAFQVGFSIINLIDPQSDVETSVFSFLHYYVGILLFLMANGHHWFFLAVSDSFRYLPVRGPTMNGPLVEEIIRLSSQVIVAGVQIAAPVIAVTILADIVLGILSRAAPQINILIVGLPLKSFAGFFSLSISFYFLPDLLGKYFIQLHRDLFAVLHRML